MPTGSHRPIFWSQPLDVHEDVKFPIPKKLRSHFRAMTELIPYGEWEEFGNTSWKVQLNRSAYFGHLSVFRCRKDRTLQISQRNTGWKCWLPLPVETFRGWSWSCRNVSDVAEDSGSGCSWNRRSGGAGCHVSRVDNVSVRSGRRNRAGRLFVRLHLTCCHQHLWFFLFHTGSKSFLWIPSRLCAQNVAGPSARVSVIAFECGCGSDGKHVELVVWVDNPAVTSFRKGQTDAVVRGVEEDDGRSLAPREA